MIVEMKNKEIELHFGWAFLEEVNKTMGIELEVEGQPINTKTGGMALLQMGLGQYDPVAVVKTIKAGTVTEKSKPSTGDIQQFLEGLMEEEGAYVEFVDELSDAIKKAPLLNALTKIGQGS